MKKRLIVMALAAGLFWHMGCSGGHPDSPPPSTPIPLVKVQPGPALHYPRAWPGDLLLQDGRVAILGGVDPNGYTVSGFEIFDSQGTTFSDAGQLLFPRLGNATLLLENGCVAILGGTLNAQKMIATQIEIWDPVTKSSTHVGDLQTLHGHGLSCISLPDGKVLLFGGEGWGPPELVDPTTWTSEVLSFTGSVRAGAAVARLPNGDVAIAGGSNGSVALGDRWTYSWQSKVFIRRDLDCCLDHPRSVPGSFVLKDGRWVLIGGGGDYGQPGLRTNEIYTGPDGPRLATTQGATGYVVGTTTQLPDDLVLLVGGREAVGLIVPGTTITRVLDPITGRFRDGQPLSVGRWAHTATRLKDGRILIVGGTTGVGALSSSEILVIE